MSYATEQCFSYPTSPLVIVLGSAPTLRTPAVVVTHVESQVEPYYREMLELMVKHRGIGLAAPQVGISRRFFVTGISRFRVVINPSFKPVGISRTSAIEGCLTWPGAKTFVARFDHIIATWTDLVGLEITRQLSGNDARVFQHETDHLNGVCIFK